MCYYRPDVSGVDVVDGLVDVVPEGRFAAESVERARKTMYHGVWNGVEPPWLWLNTHKRYRPLKR